MRWLCEFFILSWSAEAERRVCICAQEALDAETESGLDALARSISATSLGSHERDGHDMSHTLGSSVSLSKQHTGAPLLSKLESIASSAVRAADKVGAALIIVYTQSGAHAPALSSLTLEAQVH